MDRFDVENNNSKLIEGPIPPKALMVAQKQGIAPDEIWGSYFPPDDDRNPNMGEHYLGLVTLSPNEVRGRLSKERSRMQNTTIQTPWISELGNLVAASDTELARFFEIGISAIKKHELTHKNQQDNLVYQTLVLRAYWVINITKDYAQKSKIRANYQDLVLLAEVQALAAQCSTATEDLGNLKKFNIYWFSKTFKLFNDFVTKDNVPQIKSFDASSGKIDIDYTSQKVGWIEDVYTSLRNKSDFNPNISNIYGLTSRALYLCDDPAETLENIREGKISFKDFESKVLNGLEAMIKMSPDQIVSRGETINEQLVEPFKNKVEEVRHDVD